MSDPFQTDSIFEMDNMESELLSFTDQQRIENPCTKNGSNKVDVLKEN